MVPAKTILRGALAVSDPESSWKDNPVWAEWGQSLVLEYPEGLGVEPDFSSDGTALFVWSRNGFVRYQRQMWNLGETKKYRIGEKTFEAYPENSKEDQIYIARTAFNLAKAYWHYAKKESDQQAANAREIARIERERADELKSLEAEVAKADTLQALEIKAAEVRDHLRTAGNNAVHLHQQLDIVQTQLIKLERKNARDNWRWAVGGFVVGFLGLIAGIGFPAWDMAHRAEPPIQRETQNAKPAAPDGVAKSGLPPAGQRGNSQ